LKNPDVYIGRVENVDWTPDESPDDDVYPESTPEEVVQILGFDPMEENDDDAE